MGYDEIAAACKLKAEREQYEAIKAEAQCPRPPSMREQAEKSVGYHRTEADKADRAAAFFREHPEFDEFIGLIRGGAVQI